MTLSDEARRVRVQAVSAVVASEWRGFAFRDSETHTVILHTKNVIKYITRTFVARATVPLATGCWVWTAAALSASGCLVLP